LITETLHQRISGGRETFDDRPRTFEGVPQSMLDVFMRALIPLEHILSSLCELCLDKSKELDIY
jgi:hypothetical protein